jgi:hypothetical protein
MFSPNIWYVITIFSRDHYETRVWHPRDAIQNRVYTMSQAVKIKVFDNIDQANNYASELSLISSEYKQIQDIANSYKYRIMNY